MEHEIGVNVRIRWLMARFDTAGELLFDARFREKHARTTLSKRVRQQYQI